MRGNDSGLTQQAQVALSIWAQYGVDVQKALLFGVYRAAGKDLCRQEPLPMMEIFRRLNGPTLSGVLQMFGMSDNQSNRDTPLIEICRIQCFERLRRSLFYPHLAGLSGPTDDRVFVVAEYDSKKRTYDLSRIYLREGPLFHFGGLALWTALAIETLQLTQNSGGVSFWVNAIRLLNELEELRGSACEGIRRKAKSLRADIQRHAPR